MQKLLQDIHIGGNLKKLRKERNITQTEMATRMQLLGRSMSVYSYSHIERGKRNIYISDLILFSKIFDISFDEFFVDL